MCHLRIASVRLHFIDIKVSCTQFLHSPHTCHIVYMRARAMENMVHTLYCNYVGDEKRFHYCGQSCAYDPTGQPLAEAGNQEETMLYVPVDLSLREGPLRDLNYLKNRRKELYHEDLR